MKTIKYSLIISLLTIFTFCTPDNEGVYGDVVNREQQIMGTWSIQNVYQVDLDAEKKSFPDFATKVEITNSISSMSFSGFSLTLGKGTITTVNGNSPMSFIISEGTGNWEWIADDEVKLVNEALGINASSGITTTINGQTVNLYIKSFEGILNETPKLSINYERFDSADNLVMRYEYNLIKQN